MKHLKSNKSLLLYSHIYFLGQVGRDIVVSTDRREEGIYPEIFESNATANAISIIQLQAN
jgi:hypothetical protein